MPKRMLAVGLAIGLAILASCGSTTTLPSLPGNGVLYTFLGDAPVCNVLSFQAIINGLTFTQAGSTNTNSAFSSATASINVNLSELQEFTTLLNVSNLRGFTYDKATVTFSVATISIYDPTSNPPIKLISARLANSNPTVTLNPPFTVTAGQVNAVRVDFDLSRSIQVNAQGNVTGDVTPVITVAPLTTSGSQGFGEIDELEGFVAAVTPVSSNPSFTGGFALQILSGSGPLVTVNLTNSTQVCAPPTASDASCTSLPLNQLLTGSFVEADGFVDSNGNFVAHSVEVEDAEAIANRQLAYLGIVTSLTTDPNGNVTQFQLFIREEEPEDQFDVPLNAVAIVNVSPTTVYQFSSRSANFANLPFDASALAVGQEVVVHGVFTKPPAQNPVPPVTIASDKVYVKLQTDQGHFSSIVSAGSDNKTGAFWLIPCSGLFQGARILVLTNSQTTFLNLSGLSALAAQPALAAKGLLFFELQGKTVNGVPVPPKTLVLVAKQVHQLQ